MGFCARVWISVLAINSQCMVHVWHGRSIGYLPARAGYADCNDSGYATISRWSTNNFRCFWNCLLPGVTDTSLSSDTVAYTELLHRVSDMELPRVENLARPVVNNCVKVNLGPNAPGMTALQLDEECLTLYYGEQVCLLPYQAGNLVQSCLWNDSAIPCVIAAGWRTPDTILFRIHLLGERLGVLVCNCVWGQIT